jgi:hypothetical protein
MLTPEEKIHRELLKLTRDVEALGAKVRQLLQEKELRLAAIERRLAVLERAEMVNKLEAAETLWSGL